MKLSRLTAWLVLLALVGCGVRPGTAPTEELGSSPLAEVRAALDSDLALQRVLLDPRHFESGLRDQPEFRALLREAALRLGVHRLTLAPEDEPGEWIEVEGRLVEENGMPVAGGSVSLSGTDEAGRYHPSLGEECPRLFGTVVSDSDGRFSIRTVRPGPYPGTRHARHFHVAVEADGRRLAAPGYVVFDDDPLLAEPQNEEQRGEALVIRMRRGPAGMLGELVLPVR